MEKTDLLKTDKSYYTARQSPELYHCKPTEYISITGQGDPDSTQFATHIQALYTVAYALKFASKKDKNDFVVAKLEGLWWFDEAKFHSISMSDAPKSIPRGEWNYRLLIRMPHFVGEQDLNKIIPDLIAKGKTETLKQVVWYKMNEGKVVQALHIGPFSTEPDTLNKIQAFTTQQNLQRNGLHHEIYLSDFRKTPQEKRKTILREPVK